MPFVEETFSALGYFQLCDNYQYFPGGAVVKNLPTHARDTKDMGSLAWRIPWTEELGRLQSMGSKSVRHD